MHICIPLVILLELVLSSCLAFAETTTTWWQWRQEQRRQRRRRWQHVVVVPNSNDWRLQQLRCGGGNPNDSNNDNEQLDVDLLPDPIPAVDIPKVWATTDNDTGGKKKTKEKKRGLLFFDKTTPYFGFYMTERCCNGYGVAAINVFGNYMTGYFLKEHPGLMEPILMRMPSGRQLEQWKGQLPVDEIVGIICESDSGLADAERFGDMLRLEKHNGFNEARRNKYLMVEKIGSAGLAVVQQRLCLTSEEAVDFAKGLGVPEEGDGDVDEDDDTSPSAETSTYVQDDGSNDSGGSNTGILGRATNVHHESESPMCIVKPIRGAATDNVFLCKNQSDVQRTFNLIHGTPIFDSPRDHHDSVLVQEFASGTEYAIDIVSKNGQHKVAALWRYDKRPANGKSFVYHATELVDADTEVGRRICNYVTNALDVLAIRWGQTHTEVIVGQKDDDDIIRLVEVNCRQHNMDFAPLTMACIGYNSLDMTLAAFLGGNDESTYPPNTKDLRVDWDDIPDVPVTRAYGAVVHLINFADGILISINEEALKEIEEMESVFALEIYPTFLEVGSPILPTIDIRTDAGWVHLINDDKEAFQRDYERIVELMPTLFLVDNGRKTSTAANTTK